MKRKAHGGFTLVEVIVALGLAAFLASVFGAITVNRFAALNNGKSFTQDTFMAQEQTERQMENMRQAVAKQIATGDPLEVPTDTANTTFTNIGTRVFNDGQLPWLATGIQVNNLYRLKTVVNGAADPVARPPSAKAENNRIFSVLVSDQNIPALPSAEINSLEIQLLGSTGTIYSGYVTAGAHIDALPVTIVPNPRVTIQQINYQWYISKKGYNTVEFPRVLDYAENELALFPAFSNDYQIIRGATGATLVVTPDMAGKVVVLTAACATTNGKIGPRSVSNRIFIDGLPLNDKAILHMSAGTINRGVETDLAGDPTKDGKILVWNSVPGAKPASFSAIGTALHTSVATGKSPPDANGLSHIINARAVLLKGTAMGSDAEIAGTGEGTVFVIARTDDFTKPAFSWGGVDFGFKVTGTPTPEALSSFHLLAARCGPLGNFTYWNNEPSAVADPDIVFDGGKATLNPVGANQYIAEVVIFDKELTDDELEQVRKHLIEKYGISTTT